jgi:hypothetical protein
MLMKTKGIAHQKINIKKITMKKGLIVSAIVFTSLFGLQHQLQAQVNAGIKAGISLANTEDMVESPSGRTGYYAGGQVVIPVVGKLFLQPEIIFSSKGYKYRAFATEKPTALRLNYVNFPMLAGYKIFKDTRVLLGVEAGYLLKATLSTPYRKETLTDNFPEKFDIGIAAGITQKFGEHLGFEGRYIYGLPGFYQVDNTGARKRNDDASNRVIQAGLFYRFI